MIQLKGSEQRVRESEVYIEQVNNQLSLLEKEHLYYKSQYKEMVEVVESCKEQMSQYD